MSSDEIEIRNLVQTWITATKAGDIETVLGLMADDMLFLLPGRPPMTKAEFAAGGEALKEMDFEGSADVEECQVIGDWAYTWTNISVAMGAKGGGAVNRSSGSALSILKKLNGKWVLFRDANMVTPEPE